MESTFLGRYDTEVRFAIYLARITKNVFIFILLIIEIFFYYRKPFFIEPNNTIEVDMMYNGGNFPFYEDKSLGVKILALPYKGLEVNI